MCLVGEGIITTECGMFLGASLSRWMKLGSYEAKAHSLATITNPLGKSMTSVFPSTHINITDTPIQYDLGLVGSPKPLLSSFLYILYIKPAAPARLKTTPGMGQNLRRCTWLGWTVMSS